jgi:hypothetical protein
LGKDGDYVGSGQVSMANIRYRRFCNNTTDPCTVPLAC